jgi:hypothetical protein
MAEIGCKSENIATLEKNQKHVGKRRRESEWEIDRLSDSHHMI